ncbi:glutamate ABC transporter substrate-binding protein [Lentzea sp. NPDC004782]|uniref:glutamate ABC transporter substrate-binding protein n=1 Tax=Lentzea sp. NPDC004782 TaxID=3154458 RepID=UPI0033AB9CC9
MSAPRRTTTASAIFLLAIFALTGCGQQKGRSEVLNHSTEGHLSIGITYDQPGLGQHLADDTVRGFDVDVAKYIAQRLNVPENGISWKQVPLADREIAIERGEVDFIAAAYSITAQRQQRVTFAGPYYIAAQDLLVREDEKSINGPGELTGRRLCSVKGTTSAERVRQQYAANVQLVEYPQFDRCITALLAAQVDAVTTDDVILAGYLAKNPELLRLVGRKFGEERYGIGLRKGDDEGRTRINAAIQQMISSGAWNAALTRNFPSPEFQPNPPPQVGQE